jgi:hypothetical protein
MNKPPDQSGYPVQATDNVRQAALYLATKLGDLLDEVVVVGGLVPTLLIPPSSLAEGQSPHVGTLDLDLGLGLGLLNHGRYRAVAERLKGAGFLPDVNENGNPTRQRWRIEEGNRRVVVDFLVHTDSENGGQLQNFEQDFAAIQTPGLNLAFEDRVSVPLTGTTLRGEVAARELLVCGPGAFMVLKALALRKRGENKDAYDLDFVLRNFGRGIDDVADRLRPLLSHPIARKAMSFLKEDFASIDAIGPRRVAQFLGDPDNDDLRADAASSVAELLRSLRNELR